MTKISQIVARIRKVPFGRIRYPTRTDFFARILTRDVFPRTTVSGRRQNNLDVVIGACELRTGTAFRFGNTATGGWRQGSLIGLDPEVGLAVAASAAYPILLPSIERNWTFSYNGQQIERRVLIIDGGVYDNLGINVLEPDRNPEISLHTFPCDYLIVCNAGQGQSPGIFNPSSYLPRIKRSFQIVHRRVHDLNVQRLYYLKKHQLIKGFAMPYLGQQDTALPFVPPRLIPREAVVDYPTDFAAMSPEWIEKLTTRGEQLTRLQIDFYLKDIL